MRHEIDVISPNVENIVVGELRAKFSAAGDRVLRYYIDFRHTVLDLHKELSAPEIEILQNKVDTLMATWDKKFEAHQLKESVTQGKELAEDLTLEAEQRRDGLRQILEHTLSVDDAVDWDVLKDKSRYKKRPFAEDRPRNAEFPDPPRLPVISFFDRLFGRAKRIESAFMEAQAAHKEQVIRKKQEADAKLQSWRGRLDAWDAEQSKEEKLFYERQSIANSIVDDLERTWLAGSSEAIAEHAGLVLEQSVYDDLIQKDFALQYDAESKTLLVDYALPTPEKFPIVKTFRFVGTTGELKETQISAKEQKELFDNVCYQICLRTIHELFEADTPGHLQSIGFNGSTDYLDKATGQEVHSTILSVVAEREEFLGINLGRIDPKACFKNLKGVSASSLIGLTPVAPILELDRDDRRFIEAENVELSDDGSTNLAAMGWEEFEHLVREVFDKEFAARGGEVKVTQSSSDGGVDAVAFDPDPISGGKIVIQAKRYTKTVGVAAVRDLYGTVMNEGANKGILVTTADFGPDAYKFASDKPLTLMSGSNLLHLLSRQGVKAKIDIREARAELGLKAR